eukprot:GHVR01089555.1.p1 GENE.GHVR01089555.1~~GHVR01089555.1.p1  ORF type:complete len:133 (+),score=26.45 GHVR01089555.1:25-399(+)
MVKAVRTHVLRDKTVDELSKRLDELKTDLAQLRVAKMTGASQNKNTGKIGSVRKGIARVLTVLSEGRRKAAREEYKGKRKPLDLRQKKTRAIRRRFTTTQLNKKTIKETKKQQSFPKRKYAVCA